MVQWTPATNYTDWANSNEYDITDPNGQLYWIDALSASKGQWISTSAYRMTWEQFKSSSESPEYLASAFLKNFERAGVEVESERRSCARKWYDYLQKYDAESQVIEKAVEWAISIANDNSHGYDQAHRDGPDYDCSSLICWAYYNAGLNTRPGYTPATGSNVWCVSGSRLRGCDFTGQSVYRIRTDPGRCPAETRKPYRNVNWKWTASSSFAK